MRQHAIPQNILDIEFKLFTKFTVREFVYMAIGIGFGGIFLYFFTLGQFPGFVAFPVFLFSSGTGLFLGLVNINDQKSDVFLRNYFWAITHPTQRVWKNTMIDEKFEQIKPQFNVTQGTNERGTELKTNSEIIGGNQDLPTNEFIPKAQLDEIDKEESERLAQITALAQTTSNIPLSTPPIPAASVINPVPVQAETVQPQASLPQNIKIDLNNLSNYKIELSKPLPYPGNLNFKIFNNQDQIISQAIIIIKDSELKIVSALQADPNGEVYSNKRFPMGVYSIQIQYQNLQFPLYQIVIDSEDTYTIKLKSN